MVVQQRAVALKAFLSTPSARRATPTHVDEWDDGRFLSTPSARRATSHPRPACQRQSNFYPRPPRGGRPSPMNFPLLSKAISIHALREEGDHRPQRIPRRGDISIHALREEGDRPEAMTANPTPPFLSTPSARRATMRSRAFLYALAYFYPRPPRGGRQCFPMAPMGCTLFLSTPSARRATYVCRHPSVLDGFLSTPSARRATQPVPSDSRFHRISIHALREEGDCCVDIQVAHRLISIHALREEGDTSIAADVAPIVLFLSTPSARRATKDGG